MQKLPLPALINLHSHPDEDVRRRAYEAELVLLASAREPLAACMNGIKGTTNTLNRRRGRTDALHEPVDRARIDRATLDAMLGAMADSFPTFRKYWRKKAQRLGKDQLAWWDLWAPAPVAGGAKKSLFVSTRRGASSSRTSAPSRRSSRTWRGARSTAAGSTPSSARASGAARSA